jgi:hypothetical protein
MENMMKKIMAPMVLLATLALSACGGNTFDRTASGAGIGAAAGAGVGFLFGGVGAIPGALVGAAVGGAGGLVTTPDQVDLGKPVWR